MTTMFDNYYGPVDEAMNGVFGEAVTYSRDGLDAFEVDAIFTEEPEAVDLGGEVPIMSSEFAFDIRADSIEITPHRMDTIERADGSQYEISRVEKDVDGGFKLYVTEL